MGEEGRRKGGEKRRGKGEKEDMAQKARNKKYAQFVTDATTNLGLIEEVEEKKRRE